MKYPTMKQPRGSQENCIMEMIVEGFGLYDKDLVRFNILHTHQWSTFLSDTTTAKGDNIDKLLMSDLQETHERLLGKIDQ